MSTTPPTGPSGSDTPENAAPSNSTWSRIGLKNFLWNFSTPAEVENARYESLRVEASHDAGHLHADRTELERIRETDTDPANQRILNDGPDDMERLEELLHALSRLLNAAMAHNDRIRSASGGAASDVIEASFWTTTVPELGMSGGDFVHTEVQGHGILLQSMVRGNLWVRGADASVHNRIRAIVRDFTVNIGGARINCPISVLRGMIGAVGDTQGAMDGVLRAADNAHDGRHDPSPGVTADYLDWRGAEDVRTHNWTGVMGHLRAVANHRFWQLNYEAGQPTIASRATALIARIERSMIIHSPTRITVQQLNEVQTELQNLADAMAQRVSQPAKPEHVRVEQGTEAYERALFWGNARGGLTVGSSVTLALLATYLGLKMHESFTAPPPPDKGGQKRIADGKVVELGKNLSVVAREGKRLVFTLPDDINPANIRERYQFTIRPRFAAAGAAGRTVVPVQGNDWSVDLTDEERQAGGVLLSMHERKEGVWTASIEDRQIPLSPIPDSTEPTAKAEKSADLSPTCRVTVKGTTLSVQLPSDITPANVETKVVLFIAKPGEQIPRPLRLRKTASGWEATLSAEDAGQEAIEFVLWDDSSGDLGPRGGRTKLQLK